MIQAGRLSKHIVIESLDTVATASGGTTDTPRTVAVTWASIEPLTGREAWLAKEQLSSVSHKITTRYVSGINAKMRAVYRGRIFNFESVVNVGERNAELVIMATEATA
jgi:SPP1 family predicted phage head-tail adaptor